MPSKITRRIESQAGVPGLASILSELAPSDLQSLLLEVYATRVAGLREAALLAPSEQSALVQPSGVDGRVLHRFDRIALAAAADFEALDLSPVCTLGAQSVLGGIHQNNVLTAIRRAEVLGDSTPALALEAARRRRRDRTGIVRLCATQRVVRLQPFDIPGFTPHFRLFTLVSAGRDRGSRAFEFEELARHIRFYLRLFRELNSWGFHAAAPLVEVSDLNVTEDLLARAGGSREQVRATVRAHRPGAGEKLLRDLGIQLPVAAELPEWEPLFAQLRPEFPEAEFRFNLARLEGLGYYDGICLRISPRTADGARYAVADGGFTNWTARLLQDRKERLLTSGIGSEFVCRRYVSRVFSGAASAHSKTPLL